MSKSIAKKQKKSKPKIAILSLTCCEGCQVAILDLGPRLLELLGKVEIGNFPLFEEDPDARKYDVCFIEGTPITEEQHTRLQEIRKKTKYLVAIGACACLGGIQEIKDYTQKDEIKYVYQFIEGIDDKEIHPLRELVKVDLEIPGCPINKDEFYDLTLALLMGKKVGIAQRPVCYECQIVRKNECLLKKGKPCIGPIILGGCGAPCPSVNYPCDGCRGPLEKANVKALKNQLKKTISDRDIEMIFERFGQKDEILEVEEKQNKSIPPPPQKKN